jgi:hypothetical protein
VLEPALGSHRFPSGEFPASPASVDPCPPDASPDASHFSTAPHSPTIDSTSTLHRVGFHLHLGQIGSADARTSTFVVASHIESSWSKIIVNLPKKPYNLDPRMSSAHPPILSNHKFFLPIGKHVTCLWGISKSLSRLTLPWGQPPLSSSGDTCPSSHLPVSPRTVRPVAKVLFHDAIVPYFAFFVEILRWQVLLSWLSSLGPSF